MKNKAIIFRENAFQIIQFTVKQNGTRVKHSCKEAMHSYAKGGIVSPWSIAPFISHSICYFSAWFDRRCTNNKQT